MGAWAPALAWVLAAVGIAIGGWALGYDRARGRKRCPNCWYDMRRAASLTCPECGRTAPDDRSLLRTRRRWGWAALAAVALIAAGAMTPAERFHRLGWPGLPRPVVLFAALWIDADSSSGERSMSAALGSATSVRLPRWEQVLLRFALRARVRDGEASQRAAAAVFSLTAWRSGNAVEPLVPALQAALDDEDWNVRYCAAVALAEMRHEDPALGPLWRKLLGDSRDENSAMGAAMLGVLLEQGAADHVAALLQALPAAQPMTRAQIMYALARTGDPQVAVELVRWLESGDVLARRDAINALARMEEAAAEAVPALVQIAGGADWLSRRAAIACLGAVGPSAAPAVPILAEGLGSADRDIRQRCAAALGRIGVRSPEIVSRLREGLDLPQSNTSTYLESLYRLGWVPESPDRERLARWASGHDAAAVWARLILASASHRPEGELQHLIGLLDHPDIWVVEASIEALSTLGPRAAASAPALRRMALMPRPVMDQDTMLKAGWARRALRRIETPATATGR